MDTDEYIPIEPNYYNYKGTEILNDSFSNNSTTYTSVEICAYKVNNEHKYPFLNFLFVKNMFTNTLSLPTVSIFKNFSVKEMIDYSKFSLFGLLQFSDFDFFNELSVFDGFYEYNNVLYLFFDITNCDYKTENNKQIYFVLLDELVNHKCYQRLSIDKTVSMLFMVHNELCFLNDKNNESYESPIVAYVNKPMNKASFTYTFGETVRDKNNIFGSYFYFTDFENALKCEDNKSLIRFALFMGRTKYIENYPNDPIDDSEIKTQRLKDPELDQNMEYLTVRISDHDGKWSNKFDSVYLGNIELDNGTYLRDIPMIVVKTYEQQIPLSY